MSTTFYARTLRKWHAFFVVIRFIPIALIEMYFQPSEIGENGRENEAIKNNLLHELSLFETEKPELCQKREKKGISTANKMDKRESERDEMN